MEMERKWITEMELGLGIFAPDCGDALYPRTSHPYHS